MLYSIQKMSQISGVSGRTLRYYDELGLLKPKEISNVGYRKYSDAEVDKLQQILLYKQMGLKLEEIKTILENPDFDLKQALEKQKKQLLLERNRLQQIIETVEKTLEGMKGKYQMTNEEKFKGLKEESIQKNEEKYGQEIRQKYGEEVVQVSNKKYLNLSEDEFSDMQVTESELLDKLTTYLSQPDINQTLAKEIFKLHKKWLQFSWATYQSDAHKSVAMMYVIDERFTAYYDNRAGVGSAEALNQIIQYYA